MTARDYFSGSTASGRLQLEGDLLRRATAPKGLSAIDQRRPAAYPLVRVTGNMFVVVGHAPLLPNVR